MSKANIIPFLRQHKISGCLVNISSKIPPRRSTSFKLISSFKTEQKAEAERQRADRLQRQLEQVLQSVEKNKQKEIGASIDKDPTENNTKKGG